MLRAISTVLIVAAAFFVVIHVLADGCFVTPKFVWDKQKDINEPTQKAIIACNAGHEDLVLQVKYEGPAEEFGWLVPVPNLPTVKEGSMDCFYELSKYTQKKVFEETTGTLSASVRSIGGEKPQPPPVEVIEIKTVGDYQIAVLSTRDGRALESWLNTNQFAFPPGKTDVIDSYAKRGWYFVAIKINLGKTGAPKIPTNVQSAVEQKLWSGELNPLQISFASEKCVFPLKISSVNGKPSEVQVYLFSKEPLVEPGLFEQKLAANHTWRTNWMAEMRRARENHNARMARLSRTGIPRPPIPEDQDELNSRSAINESELLPYFEVSRGEIPACSRRLSLPDGKRVWLLKLTSTFKPEEMRDLTFVPAVPELAAHLGESEGVFAAMSLAKLGSKGVPALLLAMKNQDPVARAHATAVMNSMYEPDFSPEIRAAIEPLLPALLKDSDPEVRLHAIGAVEEKNDPKCFDAALGLLRDKYPEISRSAQGCLSRQQGQASKRIPLFREMLNDTNPAVQMAGVRMLFAAKAEIPREKLLSFFSVPRMDVASIAYSVIQKPVTCEEAKPLLKNPEPMVRVLGLRVLRDNANKQSVEFAIPLLSDSEPFVSTSAHRWLMDLTGQQFPADKPEEWQKWWSENKQTFVVDPRLVAQRMQERNRQDREALMRRHNADESALPDH